MSNQGNNQGGYPPPPGGVGPGGGPQMPEQSQPVDLATSRASNQPLRIPTVPRPTLAPPRSTGGVAILGESPINLWFTQCTVIRFQIFMSTWNRKLSDLNQFQQTLSHMKAVFGFEKREKFMENGKAGANLKKLCQCSRKLKFPQWNLNFSNCFHLSLKFLKFLKYT